MASESDGVGVPSDIATLLHLLNSSEPRDPSADEAATDALLQPDHQADEGPEVSSTMMGPAGQNSADVVSSRQRTVENRFAEHIVHAMSKLARS